MYILTIVIFLSSTLTALSPISLIRRRHGAMTELRELEQRAFDRERAFAWVHDGPSIRSNSETLPEKKCFIIKNIDHWLINSSTICLHCPFLLKKNLKEILKLQYDNNISLLYYLNEKTEYIWMEMMWIVYHGPNSHDISTQWDMRVYRWHIKDEETQENKLIACNLAHI